MSSINFNPNQMDIMFYQNLGTRYIISSPEGSIFILTNRLYDPCNVTAIFFKIIPAGSSDRDLWRSLCMLVRVLWF